MKWLIIVGWIFALSACQKNEPMKAPSSSTGYTMVVANDYEEVKLYFEGDYLPSSAQRHPTEAEFHAAHDVIAKHLNRVGKATEKVGDYEKADFILCRYFDPRAAINVVSSLRSPRVIDAVVAAQKELNGGFAINLDSGMAYVSVVPDGRVIGYASKGDSYAESMRILEQYGFDVQPNGEQAVPSGGDESAD